MYETPDDLLAGRYRLVRHLGQGGMGRVWLAHDETLRRDVAVKELVFPSELPERDRDELRERARREARAVARLNHPNVVGIHDVLGADSTPWIVMEYVPSTTLAEVLRAEGRMPPRRVAQIGLAVLAALKAAHATGLLHRDVKPANVLLAADGRVVLSDFGLASAAGDSAMTHTGIVLGSPSYLAPERLDDLEAGPASDLWSLGVTLYAAVEGKSPWQRSSAYATVAALVAREPLPPPTYAGPLGPVLEGLLTWDPAERLDAAGAQTMLQQVVDGPDRSPSPAGAAPPARPPANRWLLAGILAAAIVVAGVIVGAGLINHRSSAPDGPLLAFPAPAASESQPGHAAQTETEAGASAGPSATGKPTVTGSSPRDTVTATKPPTTKTATTKATTAPLTPVATADPLANLASGQCIDVPDGNPATTAEIQLWDCQNGVGQAFTLTGDGLWHVVGKCLEMRAGTKGSNLRIATCTGGALQKFALHSDGTLTVQGGWCIEPAEGVFTNGTWLRSYTCNGSDYQSWHLK